MKLLQKIFIFLTIFTLFVNSDDSITESIVTISSNNKFLCTGTLLDVDFVLTSASCLKNIVKEQVTILASTNESQKINEVHIHPSYNEKTLENDLALIRVKAFDTLPNTLTSIETPKLDVECEIIGHKQTDSTKPLIPIKAKVVETGNCKSLITSVNQTLLICINSEEKEFSHGSSLFCDNNLAGIILNNPDKSSWYVGFTDLSKYNQWIDDVFRTVVLSDKSSSGSTETQAASQQPEKVPSTVSSQDTIQKEGSLMDVVKDICNATKIECQNNSKNCRRGVFPYVCFFPVQQLIQEKNKDPFQQLSDFLNNRVQSSVFENLLNQLNEKSVREFMVLPPKQQISFPIVATPWQSFYSPGQTKKL